MTDAEQQPDKDRESDRDDELTSPTRLQVARGSKRVEIDSAPERETR